MGYTFNMANEVSPDEEPMSSRDAARRAAWEQVEKRAAGALTRLEEGATSEEGASFVAAMLETAADLLERQEVAEPLPVDEQRVWEAVGARFEAGAAMRTSNMRTLVAFGDLVARSFRGVAAIAEALDVDRSRISQRLQEPSLYAFRGPDDERYFPRWQVHGGKILPGLRAVLRELNADAHPLTVDHWFTTPNVDLEIDDEPVSPVGWLVTGGDAETAAGLAADV